MIEIEEIPEPIRSESSIPREVTKAILTESELPEKLPSLKSAMIEDFITSKLGPDAAKNEDIVEAFFEEDMPRRILEYQKEVEGRAEEIDWEEISQSLEEIRSEITEEMKSLGMTENQVKEIKNVDININEGISSSTSEILEKRIDIQTSQIVRKAIDYEKVFGKKVPFKEIIQALFRDTVGHELGHQIDRTVSLDQPKKLGFSVDIPYQWEEPEKAFKSEKPRERFAEYWGRTAVSDQNNYQSIAKNQSAILVAECDNTWKAIKEYNSSHKGFEVDIQQILNEISQRCLEKDNPEYLAASNLMAARRGLYSSDAPENYAVPYTRDLIEQAIKGEINKK